MKKTLLLLTAAASLLAHDLYLRPRAFRIPRGRTALVEFHNGDAFPQSQSPPVLARVRDAQVVSAGGVQPVRPLRVEGRAAVADFRPPDAAAFLLIARTVPNYIELAPHLFTEYLEHESLLHVIEWRRKHGEADKPGRELYSKYVKSIVHTGGPDPFVCKPTGQTIEFVPQVDPAALQLGQPLQVQVLFRGAPAAGLHVEAASNSLAGAVKLRQLGRTDAQGRISIPLDTAGLWKLHAIKMERRTDTREADWESFWASLTFEVRP
ncbi:MAG: DUF4198 domain-containing protein [Bryobacterales bacterium]|nr:DUF4198 domain-containing protein [Bryobacterales bacterium]